jgi:hypothetical protein
MSLCVKTVIAASTRRALLWHQCSEPEVQARWLAMADAWLKRSMELSEHRRVMKHELSEPWLEPRP